MEMGKAKMGDLEEKGSKGKAEAEAVAEAEAAGGAGEVEATAAKGIRYREERKTWKY